jgi:CheY-like chemotaxis protein
MRILLLEDSADDADLLAMELASAGLECDVRRVTGGDEFRALLAGFAPDVVVSDANIPGFPYREAMALVRERGGHTPFVVVSGIDLQDLPHRELPHGADAWLCKDRMQDVVPALLKLTGRAFAEAVR